MSESKDTPKAEDIDAGESTVVYPQQAWQMGKSLQESFSVLLSRQIYTDVTFRVKDGDSTTSVKAHRIVLATRSPVFEAMFYGQLAETAEEIEIPDVEADIFQLFLQFLYTDAVELMEETVADVTYVGDKYQVDSLLEFCSKFLSEKITLDNALGILDLALQYQQYQLAESALKFIDDHAEEILNSDAFLSITHNALLAILQGDTFCADELAVYNAAIKWAKNACSLKSVEVSGENMRSVLGKAYYYIRLPTIPQRQVAAICIDGLLSHEEQANLFCYINKPEFGKPTSNCVNPRKPRIDTCVPTLSGYEVQSKENVKKLCTSISIQCQESIILKSFKLTHKISPAVHTEYNYFELAFSGDVTFSHSEDTFTFQTKPAKFLNDFVNVGQHGVLLEGSVKPYKLSLNIICKTCPEVAVPVLVEDSTDKRGKRKLILKSTDSGGPNCPYYTGQGHMCRGSCYSSTGVRCVSLSSIDVQVGDRHGPAPICSFSYADKYRFVVALQYENVSDRKISDLR